MQPQDAPGAVPLALGYEAGRCKLVLSLRGNAQADSVLQGVPAARQGLMMEAMTAHEIGHCQRYAQGDWHALPRGFVEPPGTQRGKLTPLAQELRETRREEAYADLVALAWMHGTPPRAIPGCAGLDARRARRRARVAVQAVRTPRRHGWRWPMAQVHLMGPLHHLNRRKYCGGRA